MRGKGKGSSRFEAGLGISRGLAAGALAGGEWIVQCHSPAPIAVNGPQFKRVLRWEEIIHNLIVNEGLEHILDVIFKGGTQVDPWYVGLLASSPTVLNAWTATEVGANDFVNYDEATLQELVDGAISGTTTKSLDNSASKAVFTISTNGSTIGGAFLISTSTKATPAGTVYAAGAFSGGDKSADDDDTISVTATFTQTDDGV